MGDPEPGFWWHTYKRVWKQNFKSSLVPGAVFTLLWTLVAYTAFVLPQMTTVSVGFALVLVVDMVLLLTLGSYYWMQNALFDASVTKKLSNSVCSSAFCPAPPFRRCSSWATGC